MLLSDKRGAICWVSTLVSRMVLRVSGVGDSVTSTWFSCHDDHHTHFTKKFFFNFRGSKNFQHLDILNSSSNNLSAELRTNHSHFFFFFHFKPHYHSLCRPLASIYLKYTFITNENLLYNTGNSTQCLT